MHEDGINIPHIELSQNFIVFSNCLYEVMMCYKER